MRRKQDAQDRRPHRQLDADFFLVAELAQEGLQILLLRLAEWTAISTLGGYTQPMLEVDVTTLSFSARARPFESGANTGKERVNRIFGQLLVGALHARSLEISLLQADHAGFADQFRIFLLEGIEIRMLPAEMGARSERSRRRQTA